jgi:hypothetical protein
VSNANNTAPFRYPEGRHGCGELRYVNELPVLTVEGEPDDVGESIGALALRPAPRMAGYPEDSLRHYWAGFLHRPLAWLGDRLVRNLPAEYRAELDALARGAGLDRSKLVVGNTLFDIKKFIACSAVLIEPMRSPTGFPLLGRNLDYPSMGYAHEYGLVTIYRGAAGRRSFASVGFPGLIGCLSGMNDAGLALAVLEVFQAPLFTRRLDLGGTPYAVCFRRLLEQCCTIDEARDMLARMRRTTIFNLALADRHRVAVFEVTTRRVRERGPEQGAGSCTNHFCAEELQPLWSFNVYKTLTRHDVLRRALRETESFGIGEVHSALHAASNAEETLQTMVFEPGALRLHLAIGTCPASAGELRALELAPLFAVGHQ